MKTKKHTIFLLISLAIFSVTAIIGIIYLCKSKADIHIVSDTQLRYGLGLSWFFNLLGVAGILGTELSFIRSVYKILKFRPNKWARLCYIISALLAFLILAIFCLIIIDIFDYVSPRGRVYVEYIVLYGFPTVSVLSFILGSMPSGYLNEICKYD